MTYLGALLLTLLTGGKVDYLPNANRPWCVVSPCGQWEGRGRTLREAWRDSRRTVPW